MGGRAPLQEGEAVTRVGQLRLGAALHDCPSLHPPVKGAKSSQSRQTFLPLLDQEHQVLARERYPLVLKLDTFVETTRRKPALRGPRLHVL